MLKLKQYLCKHDYEYLAREKDTSQNLWQCKKCKVFYVQHWGIGVGVKCKDYPIMNWIGD